MNNYSILGLKSGATLREVKLKFRSLSKQLHPDVNGGDKTKTDRFIIVLAAYEALLKGDAGEQKTEQRKYQKPKAAEYRFIGIKKDDVGYVISFYVERVSYIVIRGKEGNSIGSYSVEGKEGIVRLEVLFEAAKKAKYYFEVTLLDSEDNYATKIYKVKPPKVSFLQKIKNIFK